MNQGLLRDSQPASCDPGSRVAKVLPTEGTAFWAETLGGFKGSTWLCAFVSFPPTVVLSPEADETVSHTQLPINRAGLVA